MLIKYAKKVANAIPNENIFTNTFLWLGSKSQKVEQLKSIFNFFLVISGAVQVKICFTSADNCANPFIYNMNI